MSGSRSIDEKIIRVKGLIIRNAHVNYESSTSSSPKVMT